MPSTFTGGAVTDGSEDEVFHQRVAVARRAAPDVDVRRTMSAGMLVARHFGHAQAFPQRLDDHLLLDGRVVLAQIELAQDAGPDRPEPVLALAQPALEPPVDGGGDERAAGETE